MEHERDVADYRERLLEALQAGASRSACDASDSIQVFVNQRRVGLLDGAGVEATLQVQTDARIDTIQLRSEDGVLLGGLSAPEYGFRSAHIPLTRSAIDLEVRNTPQGGSLSAAFTPGPGLWHRARLALTRVATRADRHPAPTVAYGTKALALTQALLAIVVVGLATDRMTGWLTPERTPPPVTPAEAPWAAPLAEVAKLKQQLVELAQMQMKAVETMQTQQQGMAQLQRTMAKLSSSQETVASSVLTVKQDMEQRRKASRRDIERVTQLLMSQAHTGQEQLEAEIHSLTVANDRLSKEMADLEKNNQDLKKRLKSAGVDVSKATVSDRDKPMVAQQTEPSQPPQVAEARPNAQQQPFLFWVTFSEGTSQESIDQWVNDMHGHKGALSNGWQAVEIGTPAEPMDRFLDQIKQAKIVKAVRVSR
jgi:hypothetical protein